MYEYPNLNYCAKCLFKMVGQLCFYLQHMTVLTVPETLDITEFSKTLYIIYHYFISLITSDLEGVSFPMLDGLLSFHLLNYIFKPFTQIFYK